MPKRSSKPPADPVTAAFKAVQKRTDPEREKNPAAVALGRLGGQKGGKARAAKLTPEERSEIARKAAAKRWNGSNSEKATGPGRFLRGESGASQRTFNCGGIMLDTT